jgi:hypothetical protein
VLEMRTGPGRFCREWLALSLESPLCCSGGYPSYASRKSVAWNASASSRLLSASVARSGGGETQHEAIQHVRIVPTGTTGHAPLEVG